MKTAPSSLVLEQVMFHSSLSMWQHLSHYYLGSLPLQPPRIQQFIDINIVHILTHGKWQKSRFYMTLGP